MHPDQSSSKPLRTLRMLWCVFLLNPLTFAAVLWFAAVPEASVEPTIIWALMGTALLEVPMLFFIRRLTLGHLALIEPRDLRVTEIADAEGLTAAIAGAAARYSTGSIISFALVESILVMGFVASFLSGEAVWFAATTVLFWMLLLVVRPQMAGVMCLMTGPQRQALRRVTKA